MIGPGMIAIPRVIKSTDLSILFEDRPMAARGHATSNAVQAVKLERIVVQKYSSAKMIGASANRSSNNHSDQ